MAKPLLLRHLYQMAREEGRTIAWTVRVHDAGKSADCGYDAEGVCVVEICRKGGATAGEYAYTAATMTRLVIHSSYFPVLTNPPASCLRSTRLCGFRRVTNP